MSTKRSITLLSLTLCSALPATVEAQPRPMYGATKSKPKTSTKAKPAEKKRVPVAKVDRWAKEAGPALQVCYVPTAKRGRTSCLSVGELSRRYPDQAIAFANVVRDHARDLLKRRGSLDRLALRKKLGQVAEFVGCTKEGGGGAVFLSRDGMSSRPRGPARAMAKARACSTSDDSQARDGDAATLADFAGFAYRDSRAIDAFLEELANGVKTCGADGGGGGGGPGATMMQGGSEDAGADTGSTDDGGSSDGESTDTGGGDDSDSGDDSDGGDDSSGNGSSGGDDSSGNDGSDDDAGSDEESSSNSDGSGTSKDGHKRKETTGQRVWRHVKRATGTAWGKLQEASGGGSSKDVPAGNDAVGVRGHCFSDMPCANSCQAQTQSRAIAAMLFELEYDGCNANVTPAPGNESTCYGPGSAKMTEAQRRAAIEAACELRNTAASGKTASCRFLEPTRKPGQHDICSDPRAMCSPDQGAHDPFFPIVERPDLQPSSRR